MLFKKASPIPPAMRWGAFCGGMLREAVEMFAIDLDNNLIILAWHRLPPTLNKLIQIDFWMGCFISMVWQDF